MPRRLLPLLVMLALAVRCAVGGETLDVVADIYREQPAGSVVKSTIDKQAASDVFKQARRAADAGEVSAALQLATRTLRLDPGHAGARRVLGYEKVDGRWLTPFQKKQVQRGYVWDKRFGWLKGEELPRYESGQRRDGRRWLSADQDTERHAVIEDGWRVRTDHFEVTSNHSLGTAARIAAELEGVFQVWRQLFAGYYLGAAEVRARFEGTRTARSRGMPFNVFYHRDKAGYVAHLRHKQWQIADTLGIYFDDTREAHFFAVSQEAAKAEGGRGKGGRASDGAVGFRLPPTAIHEAVHQFFQESKRARRGAGRRHNYWAVEGVAAYFESLHPVGDGRYAIGGATAGRLANARHRLIHPDPAERYFLPLEEMASLGRDGFRPGPDAAKLYGQAAAVATFLMHSNGQYSDGPGGSAIRREAFVRYLADLYAGRAREDGLAKSLGEPWGDLQLSYQRWLSGVEDAPAR